MKKLWQNPGFTEVDDYTRDQRLPPMTCFII